MKSQTNNPEWHLSDPRTRKWMVQCVVCQRIGYRADAPEQFFGRVHLAKHFEPLDVDSAGMCENCSKALSAK